MAVPVAGATYLKVRDGGRIVSVAAIIAMAVSTDGRREIVGPGIGASETEPFWSALLRGLVKRGLSRVKLLISDAHERIAPRDHSRPRRHLAKVSGALDEECLGACAEAHHGRLRDPPAGRCC